MKQILSSSIIAIQNTLDICKDGGFDFTLIENIENATVKKQQKKILNLQNELFKIAYQKLKAIKQ